MKKSPRGHSWLHPSLEERAASYGNGIFTKSDIASGTLLWISGGHVMRLEDEPTFPDGRSDLAMQIHDEFCIGPLLPDEIEPSNSTNHSCDPNAGFQGQIFLVAMRDIKADEQVCFDYAMVLNLPGCRFDCRCGSKNCRGTITGEDWKLPDLQKRYTGYFQWYLEKRIREESSPWDRRHLAHPYPKLLAELRPSQVAKGECGVFSVRCMKKGTVISAAHRYDEGRFVQWSESESLDLPTREALRRFCLSSSEGYHAPENLNFIHPMWYCNHSCDPNVAYDAIGNLCATREIDANEELLLDYSALDRHKPPSFPASDQIPCRCGSSNCKGLVDFL